VDKFKIRGGNRLHGALMVGGAKNAALPIMAASLLTREDVVLSNVPDLDDIHSMQVLMQEIGAEVDFQRAEQGFRHSMIINASNCNNLLAPYHLVSKMRASVLVLGPLLARFGKAQVSLPGGCAIGARPVDMHVNALRLMGAEVGLENGYIIASAPDGLQGAEIFFEKISVGATENILMAAALAKGTTVIHNVAKEPEVVDLANFLIKMGAKISGVGQDVITVEGVSKLDGVTHDIIPDRIEAGTFAVIAAATGGKLEIHNCQPSHLEAPLYVLRNMGVKIDVGGDCIIVESEVNVLHGTNITTAPYPNFPTDLQAQFTALAAVANGVSHITESIFENRFMHVNELMRMGAEIIVNDNILIINGVSTLKPAEVMASDLRGSASLVIAGLAAPFEGNETIINRIYHLDRGYEKLEVKLAGCGAVIERISE
jgi:UDP-N-acetylglucosamine 1-carboxyvinyltransferase